MNQTLLSELERELSEKGDEKTRESAARFFKEPVMFHGVKSPEVRRIASKRFRDLRGLHKSELFSLCEGLLASGYGEEAFIASDWAYRLRDSFAPEDFSIFERWVDHYVDNWAKCDTLCNHAIGAFVEMYPQFIEDLRRWARSENRWMQRASAVTLILPARKGLFLTEAFSISDILLEDGDDMVQKGYGWLLKEASKKHQPEVFEYVMERRQRMPRTALRYAIEKMPEEMRKRAMKRP